MEKNVKKKAQGKKKTPKKSFADAPASNKKWYQELPDVPPSTETVPVDILISLKEEARKCYDAEVANYNTKNSKSSSNLQWMKTMISKGTASDKIAAFVVLTQDNPICNLEHLRNLVGTVKAGKKKDCISVMESLTELFLNDLLKPDQKLRPFHQQPLSSIEKLSSGNVAKKKKIFTLWYFEDQLKEAYTEFIQNLNRVAHDTVDSNKEKAIAAMNSLITGNPEQEKNILSHLINKLGDPVQKVASKAIYCLNQLLHKHPNMQGVVLKETEKLLYRSNVSSRAQYYAICFLSQFYLSHEDSNVARNLIEVYFSFFKSCIKKGEIDSRMMAALLMGVNRAYPYAKNETEKVSEHLNTMYKIVNVGSFNVGLHALSLLLQVSDFENGTNDRFFSALYKKLLDPQLGTTTHQAMFLSLVYKALMKDKQAPRVKVFIKRLLQVASNVQPTLSIGVLYLVSQVLSRSSELRAFVSECEPEERAQVEEENEEEKYVDSAVKQEDGTVKEEIGTNAKAGTVSGWVHFSSKQTKPVPTCKRYDSSSRNPLYSGGEVCSYTELTHLQNHFHPTVSLYAQQILKGETINYSGDPLKDFTLIRFLDRFVFKNPKKEVAAQQGCHPTFGKRKAYAPTGIRAVPVNSTGYLNENQKNIPVEELFMYTYLQRRKQEKLERGENDDESDIESVASDEFEEMLDKMTGNKRVEDDDLDFMNDIGENLKSKDGKSKGLINDDEEEEGVEEEESEIDEGFDGEDDLIEDEDKELLDGLSDDEAASDIVFDSDEEEPQAEGKKRRNKKKDTESLFASAEEFAELLDEEGLSSIAPGSSQAVSNKDKANTKQIVWEEKRNRWIKGYNKAMGKEKFNKKRKAKHNSHKSNKKIKK